MFGSLPPPRRSSWSWRGRTRRNSLSEGPQPISTPMTGQTGPRPGRSSLSAIDTRTADSMRGEVAAWMATANPNLNPQAVDVGVQGGQGADEAKNNRRSSIANSRPPPAFYNVPYTHKRRSPVATALHNSFVSYNDALLRPPPSGFRNPAFVGPPVSPSPTAAPLVPVVVLPMGAGMPVAMYPPREQDFITRTQRASQKIQQVTEAQPVLRGHYYVHTPLVNFIPTAQPVVAYHGMEHPTLQIRPRSSSASSTSSASSNVSWSRESFESRLRSSSVSSSRTSIESMPPYGPGSRPVSSSSCPVHGPQGYPWQRQVPIRVARRKAKGEIFAALPGEVLELILQELRKLHIKEDSNSCETCWMRDCCSAALSARKFLKYAREALYQHVHLVGDDSTQMKKRTKLNHGARLVLLRRTLRSNLHIAVIVRSLKPPILPPGIGVVEYNDLVASVVMACPNFERLEGFQLTYNHSHQRLFQALSTRKRLKDMSWIIEQPLPLPPPPPAAFHRRMRPSSSHRSWPSEDLQPRETQSFVDYHLNWQHLTSLVVHCQFGSMLTPNTLLGRTLRRLPSLQNLHLSHLPPTTFYDGSLLALPSLKKLTLSHLPGITTAGLSSFATCGASASLISLTLIHIHIETLPVLARLFSNLTSLSTFNLVQPYAPALPSDEVIWLFPYLASSSLRRLHWDIPYLPTRATTADTVLAKSIQAGGFPALRFLRAPNDPEGVFQALCRPLERADYPTDRYHGQQQQGSGHKHAQSLQPGSSRPPSSWSHRTHARTVSAAAPTTKKSPASPIFPPDALMMPRENSNLHQARLAAQYRIEAARRFPRYCIDVINEHGVVVEKHGVGAFIGTAGSHLNYVLSPDDGGADEGGGLVQVKDMLGDRGESLALGRSGDSDKGAKKWSKREKAAEVTEEEPRTREGCCGRWNAREGPAVDIKKERERWWHTERGRWRAVVLS